MICAPPRPEATRRGWPAWTSRSGTSGARRCGCPSTGRSAASGRRSRRVSQARPPATRTMPRPKPRARNGYRGYRVAGTVTPIGAKAPAAVRKRVLEAVRAVRKAVPEDFPLLYRGVPARPPGGVGDRPRARRGRLHLVRGSGRARTEALGRLAAELDTPVLATVSGPDAGRQAAAHLSRQSADLIRVRIPDAGGITEALKIGGGVRRQLRGPRRR